MKRINLFAGVLFVLVGFCEGVGFSLFSTNIEAQGRPEPPPPAALKSVAHDATLTGDGTTLAPLGLANGAVTARKLSAAAVPSVGQVLGFNGANLAWQDAPVGGGVRVMDSLGQVVGPLVLSSFVLRQVGPLTFLLYVGRDGFPSTEFSLAHTTPNCSGSRFYYVSGQELYRPSSTARTQLIFPAGPLQQITVRSFERIPEGADPNQPGHCHEQSPPFTMIAGLAGMLDVSTLGLVPPFHLEF